MSRSRTPPASPWRTTPVSFLRGEEKAGEEKAGAGVCGCEDAVPEVKRLCGSGVMGQSELLRGEVGKGGSPAGRGLGCLKLLLSENRDWDSAAAPSKGERAVRSDTLTGTTRLGLVKPGGGEGESLGGSWKREKVLKTTSGQTGQQTQQIFTCFKVSPFTIPMDSGGLSLGLEGHRRQFRHSEPQEPKNHFLRTGGAHITCYCHN